MPKRTDPRPRHQQIAAEIRARIVDGDLPAGSKLSSTQELMAEYDVGSPTVQRALAVLKDEGFIVGRKGIGVFVRDRQPHVVDVDAYFPPTPGGYSYSTPEVLEVQPPAEVARALGLSEGGVAILRRRITKYADEPVELCLSYHPVEIARGTKLAEPKKIKGGAPKVLAELGYPQRHMVDEVSSRLPTSEELLELDLPDDVPVIRQFRVIYSDEQRPVEVSVMVKGGHLYALRYQQPIH
jgi:GntR family transcriptional regulator